MKKLHFYGKRETGGRFFIHKFRTREARAEWIKADWENRIEIASTHSEVKRAIRILAQTPGLAWPVEI